LQSFLIIVIVIDTLNDVIYSLLPHILLCIFSKSISLSFLFSASNDSQIWHFVDLLSPPSAFSRFSILPSFSSSVLPHFSLVRTHSSLLP